MAILRHKIKGFSRTIPGTSFHSNSLRSALTTYTGARAPSLVHTYIFTFSVFFDTCSQEPRLITMPLMSVPVESLSASLQSFTFASTRATLLGLPIELKLDILTRLTDDPASFFSFAWTCKEMFNLFLAHADYFMRIIFEKYTGKYAPLTKRLFAVEKRCKEQGETIESYTRKASEELSPHLSANAYIRMICMHWACCKLAIIARVIGYIGRSTEEALDTVYYQYLAMSMRYLRPDIRNLPTMKYLEIAKKRFQLVEELTMEGDDITVETRYSSKYFISSIKFICWVESHIYDLLFDCHDETEMQVAYYINHGYVLMARDIATYGTFEEVLRIFYGDTGDDSWEQITSIVAIFMEKRQLSIYYEARRNGRWAGVH